MILRGERLITVDVVVIRCRFRGGDAISSMSIPASSSSFLILDAECENWERADRALRRGEMCAAAFIILDVSCDILEVRILHD